MEEAQQVAVTPRADGGGRDGAELIDLRFDVPTPDARHMRLDLRFDVVDDPPVLRDSEIVIDLRDHEPTVITPDLELPFAPEAVRADPAGGATALSLPAVGMWSRPDRCLPILVNLARFRQGGVSAVSTERTDLTELVVLASRRGEVDARRLARLARTYR
jgi:hypothetical protein